MQQCGMHNLLMMMMLVLPPGHEFRGSIWKSRLAEVRKGFSCEDFRVVLLRIVCAVRV